MKCQVAWNWKAARTELVVTSQKRERIVLAEAEWLSKGPSPRLIPVGFEYAHVQAKRATLRYDIMKKTKLSKLLKKRVLPTELFIQLLNGLDEALQACSDASFTTDKMLFSPDFVYLDEQLNPNFVFIPLRGMVFERRLNSPLAMIEALSNGKRVRLDSAEGEIKRERLHNYTLTEKAFSANAFRKLLYGDLGVRTDADIDTVQQTGAHVEERADTPIFLNDLFAVNNGPDPIEKQYVLHRPYTNESFNVPLDQDVAVGRSNACEVMIRGNKFMGRKHLTLRVTNGYVILTDNDSTNGTYANNKRLEPGVPVRLSLGDMFRVGGEEFFIFESEA
jgi:hypothetical protein